MLRAILQNIWQRIRFEEHCGPATASVAERRENRLATIGRLRTLHLEDLLDAGEAYRAHLPARAELCLESEANVRVRSAMNGDDVRT